MDKTLKENLSSREIWQRGGFILIFAICYSISKVVVAAIVIFQFLSLLITRKANMRLADFSQGLSAYIYHLLQYMMSNSDEKPFPFADWPISAGIKAGTATARKKAARKKTSRKKKTGQGEPAEVDDTAADMPEKKD